jgi:outer membrane protein insertion porin family
LVYNGLDSTKNPRNGIYGRFDQQFAGVGGDAEYVRTTGRLVGYYLLSEDRDIVLKGAAGAGNILPFGNDTLRITDHFFQGGQQIRGFDTRGFGPRDSGTGEALGGLNYWNVTAEVQFPLPLLPRSFGVRGALFADAGSLFGNDFSSATIQDNSELRASVGASLIWDSPFGPLRVDYAETIAEADYDDTRSFHFGISSKF